MVNLTILFIFAKSDIDLDSIHDKKIIVKLIVFSELHNYLYKELDIDPTERVTWICKATMTTLTVTLIMLLNMTLTVTFT